MTRYFAKEQLPMRFISALVFAAASMILVSVGTDYYFRYIDKTEYFTVRQPVAIDKHTYLPCETVLVDLVRTSKVNARAVSTVELILVNDSGEWYKQTVGGDDFNIDQSENQVIHIPFNLPCNMASGQYYLKAVIEYHVRDIPKNYVWESEIFNVITLEN